MRLPEQRRPAVAEPLKRAFRLASSRRQLAAGFGVLLLVAGVSVAVADPFASASPAANGVTDNAATTSLTTVKRLDLSQQTQVSATLGYAGASTVSVPSGTAPASLEQSQQSVTSARAGARRRPACTRAGPGIAGRRSAQGRGRLPRQQRRRERRFAARRRKRRPVRNRRPGPDGGPPERHRRGRQGAGRSAGALGGGSDAHPRRGLGGDLRAERGVHDAAEGRTDRHAAVSRCTRSATSRPSFSTAVCRPRARSGRGCRPARTWPS